MLGKHWTLDEVEILDPHHNDCTCARIYAIWISPNEIAFLNRHIFPEKEDPNRKEFEEMCKENILWYTTKKESLIYIGINAQLYHLGKKY